MLELELEQCRTSYQREYERTQERVVQLETENIELCKSIDDNTIDDSMKLQIANVIQENLVCFRTFFLIIKKYLFFKELHQHIQTNHAEIRKLRRVIKLVNKSFSAGKLKKKQIIVSYIYFIKNRKCILGTSSSKWFNKWYSSICWSI